MNLEEVDLLLAFCQQVDKRIVDDATVLAWYDLLGDLPYTDCRLAAVEHYRTSAEYLMPVHIRRGALAVDRERRRVARERREAERAAIEAATPTRDRSADVIELLTRTRLDLPVGDPSKLRRPEVLRWERQRRRTQAAEPNPNFRELPPPGGHPVPEEPSA